MTQALPADTGPDSRPGTGPGVGPVPPLAGPGDAGGTVTAPPAPAASYGAGPASARRTLTGLRPCGQVADAARRYGGPWLVWAILAFLVAIPVGAFLLQAFMPRLFGQGSSWFSFSSITQAFQGQAFQGLFNSIWVSTVVCVLWTWSSGAAWPG